MKQTPEFQGYIISNLFWLTWGKCQVRQKTAAGFETIKFGYPLPTFERTGENCWIRILVRFLVPHCRSWQSDALLGSELEGHQLEALAALSVACEVLIAYFDRLDAIPFEISKPFRSTAGSFFKAVSQMCTTNSLVADRFSALNERIFNTEDVQRLMGLSERA